MYDCDCHVHGGLKGGCINVEMGSGGPEYGGRVHYVHFWRRPKVEAKARAFRPEDNELDDDKNASNKFLGVNNIYEGTFPNIEMNTVPHLKLVQFIESAIKESEPDFIITRGSGDRFLTRLYKILLIKQITQCNGCHSRLAAITILLRC